MFRFTTPRHTFTFPQDPSTYLGIRITYKQNGEIILQKEKEDMTFDNGNKAYYQLTQEETAKFKAGYDVKFQAHVQVQDGNVYASEEMTLRVKDVLDNEEM